MDICGTDNLLELKEGQAGPDGSDGAGEVTEILSIRGAISITYDYRTTKIPVNNGNITHAFNEIIRTKTIADPGEVFQPIESGDFVLGGSGTPGAIANITFTNFLNTPAKLFSCHANINAVVGATKNIVVSSGTALPPVTNSKVGLRDGAAFPGININKIYLDVIDIDEDLIELGIFAFDTDDLLLWQDILSKFLCGFYYSLTIFAVKD